MGHWDDKAQEGREQVGVLAHAGIRAIRPRARRSIIEDKARRHPNHVVFQFRDTPVTLGELDDQINRAANGFLALGVKPGDKVAIMLPNCPGVPVRMVRPRTSIGAV